MYILFLLLRKKPSELMGKRVVLFSYGSGLASSMYSLRISSDTSPGSPLLSLFAGVQDIPTRLSSRQTVTPADFESTMKLREETHHKSSYSPVGGVANLFPGTYYLENVDEKYRRTYSRLPSKPFEVEQRLLPPIRQVLSNGQC